MTFSSAIEQISKASLAIALGESEREGALIIEQPFVEFSDRIGVLLEAVNPDQFEEYKLESNDTSSTVQERSAGFALASGLRRAAGEVFGSYVSKFSQSSDDDKTGDKIEFHGISLEVDAIPTLNKLSVILDIHIQIVNEAIRRKQTKVDENSNPSTDFLALDITISAIKNGYFQTLLFITTLAFLILLSLVEAWWYHVEARRSAYTQNGFFDRNSTADRIAVLEMSNTITDKYVLDKSKQGKLYNSYKHDSFNDQLYARVRVFLAGLLSLEDNTGLNKYFNCLQTVVHDPQFKHSFLRDIMQIEKLFHNPYHYIKRENHKELGRIVDTLDRISEYLSKDEQKHYEKFPAKDKLMIQAPISSVSEEQLYKKYNDKIYFAEDYFLSQFSGSNRTQNGNGGKIGEQLVFADDEEYFNSQFDRPQVRQAFILRIYMISSFLIEITPRKKLAFLQGYPDNIKHFVGNDYTPEQIGSQLVTIKRNLLSTIKRSNVAYSHLLLHLFYSESYWWQWLVYGKDEQGRPLFADRILSEANLQEVYDKYHQIFPLKEKRYFNTYASPQLTRKMKTVTGLEKLQASEERDIVTEGFRDLVDTCTDTDGLDHKSSLLWKYLHKARSGEWLELGDKIKPKDLTKEVIKEDIELKDDEGEARNEKEIPTSPTDTEMKTDSEPAEKLEADQASKTDFDGKHESQGEIEPEPEAEGEVEPEAEGDGDSGVAAAEAKGTKRLADALEGKDDDDNEEERTVKRAKVEE